MRSAHLLLPLALVTWALVHASGIHATVAGVLLAFTAPDLPGHLRRREGGRLPLAKDLNWRDVVGLSLLAGIGFTVSLLIGELAFVSEAMPTSTSRSAC